MEQQSNDLAKRIREMMIEEIQLLLELHQKELLERVMERIKEQDEKSAK